MLEMAKQQQQRLSYAKIWGEWHDFILNCISILLVIPTLPGILTGYIQFNSGSKSWFDAREMIVTVVKTKGIKICKRRRQIERHRRKFVNKETKGYGDTRKEELQHLDVRTEWGNEGRFHGESDIWDGLPGDVISTCKVGARGRSRNRKQKWLKARRWESMKDIKA